MKYFTMSELTKSTTAIKYGITNNPGKTEIKNLTALVDNVLDPLREKFGKPIYVNSGFRNSKVNALVGGSSTSQHMKGQAADIQTKYDLENDKLAELCLTMDFDQLIFEDIDKNGKIGWIHISYVSKEKNRHQVLEMRKIGGKTTYTPYKKK